MKTLSALAVGLTMALWSQPASAYVMQVVTTAPVAASLDDENASSVEDAVESAIRDVLSHAIAFTPTVVRLEDAQIIGERLYLVLLIADEEGEATMDGLSQRSTGYLSTTQWRKPPINTRTSE